MDNSGAVACGVGRESWQLTGVAGGVSWRLAGGVGRGSWRLTGVVGGVSWRLAGGVGRGSWRLTGAAVRGCDAAGKAPICQWGRPAK